MKLAAVRRRALLSSAAALTATALLSSAAIASDNLPAAGCPVVPTTQAFAPWQDLSDYFMAPAGDIERGIAGWDLTGGAGSVEGNEPFKIGRATDHVSLRLPPDSSATTGTFCVGVEHRSMRFFARGPEGGSLRVEAVFDKHSGEEKSVRIGVIDGSGAWSPTDVVPMVVNEKAPDFGNALPVALRFTPRGSGAWRIDDVYVDPYKMG